MVLCITCQAASTEPLGCMTSKFKLHLRVVHLVSIILFCHKNRARFLTNTDMYPKPRLFRVDFAHPTPDDGLGIPNSREITYGSGHRHLDCGPQTISSLLPEPVLPLKAGTRVFSFTRSDLIKYSNAISKNIAIAFSEVS